MQPFLENDSLVQVIKVHPEILQQMLSTVLNIIMFEDCRNQWSMSRPLLGLILLNEEYFKQLRDQVSILILEDSLTFFSTFQNRELTSEYQSAVPACKMAQLGFFPNSFPRRVPNPRQ